MKIAESSFIYILLLFGFMMLQGCDYLYPSKKFKLAIPETDYSYDYSASHLQDYLLSGGFSIEIIKAKNATEANRMVAEGKADLTFIMNHSTYIPEVIGTESGQLRTILPLFPRLFFMFSKDSLTGAPPRIALKNKKIGVEIMGGETSTDLERLLDAAKIEDAVIVNKEEDPDYMHFWGTYYGERATDLIEKGWSEVSLQEDLIGYVELTEPVLRRFTLPAIPGVEHSTNLHTIKTQTLLVGNGSLGDKSIYHLVNFIVKNKLKLMAYDKMYRDINESFDTSLLLYPLHEGTDAYLHRDMPSFFERYAEVIAMVFSLGALFYGIIQGIRTQIIRRRKERIDFYFLEFLEIKSNENISVKELSSRLDQLHSKALYQMTEEKLDKGDFHIFSRLVQQELNNVIRR